MLRKSFQTKTFSAVAVVHAKCKGETASFKRKLVCEMFPKTQSLQLQFIMQRYIGASKAVKESRIKNILKKCILLFVT